MSLVDKPAAEALALRVAELSSVLKQQRDELEEQRLMLEHNRKIVRDHEEIIRMQEAQLLERDAQLQAHNAEIRALRRQHAMDAEELRTAHLTAHGKLRPSGSMGVPLAAQQLQQQQQQQQNGRRRKHERGGLSARYSALDSALSPSRASDAQTPLSPVSPPKKNAATPTGIMRKQLQQALSDKVVLVRALHQLTAEMAQARAEARQYAAVSERSLSTAWRLGQLGQLGLALLEVGDEQMPADADAELDPGRWEELVASTQSSPPLSERPISEPLHAQRGGDDEPLLAPAALDPLLDDRGLEQVHVQPDPGTNDAYI